MRELTLQAQMFLWHWNTFPAERRLLHHNNNNAHNRIKGNQNKALGVVAGVSDLEYIANGTVYFIEVKRPGETQSPEQREFQRKVEAQGFRYFIVCSLEDFQTLICSIQKQLTLPSASALPCCSSLVAS